MVRMSANMEALSELDKLLMNEMPRDEEYYDDGEEELEHEETAEVSNAVPPALELVHAVAAAD